MRYTADSWFFLQLIEGKQKAKDIWEEIMFGKSMLVVSSVTIAELTRRFLKCGYAKKIDELLNIFESSSRVFVVDVNLDLARESGKISNAYNIPIIDSIVIATAIKTEHIDILTDDEHFDLPAKHKKINKISF